MAFREKLAWVQLATILLGFAVYLVVTTKMVGAAGWSLPVWAIVPALIGMGALTALLAAVGATGIAWWSPRDATAAEDERDREISRIASARAYSIAVLGIAAVISALLFEASAFVVANLLVALFVLSESIRYASEALSYHRGLR